MSIDSNNPDGIAEGGELSLDAAAARLTGSLLDSDAAPTDNPEGEQSDEDDQVDDVEEGDEVLEAGDQVADDDVEYEEVVDESAEEEDLRFDINGEEVSLDDIGKGYLRLSDYTKKTQEVAVERKAVEQEKAFIAAERAHLKNVLDSVQKSATPETDWVQLAQDDPLEYTHLRAVHDANQQESNAQKAEHNRLQHVANAEQAAEIKTYVAGQAKLMVESIPELQGENAAQYKSSINSYMIGVGYSKEELKGLFDHRIVMAFDKARKFDELSSKNSSARKKVKGKIRVLKPGAPKTRRTVANRDHKKAQAKLRNSGSVDDAVALLLS